MLATCTLSIHSPLGAVAAALVSDATLKRRTTVWPTAAAGRLTLVWTKPAEAPLHAGRLTSGELNDGDTVWVYPPVTKLPPAVTMSVKAPAPILISSTAASNAVTPEDSRLYRLSNSRIDPAVTTNEALSSVLSVTVIGVSVLAEFGADTEKAVVVTHGLLPAVTVETHPSGSAGAVTPSKFWRKSAGASPQTSPTVHALPSSQSFVLFVKTHNPFAALHESVVHTLPSLQTIAVPVHTPPEQTSPVVHRLPSLQAAVLAVCTQPEAGLHESSVHGLLSLQSTAHCVTVHVVVVTSSVHAERFPPSRFASSPTDSVQTPFGFCPTKAERCSSDTRVCFTTRLV